MIPSSQGALNHAGQTQILGVLLLTTTMLTGGLFVLEFASRNQIRQIGQSRGVEMRMAIESAIRHAQQLWRAQAGCDRVVFNNLLNRLRPDGTISAEPSPTCTDCRRQLEVTINDRIYRVALGPIDVGLVLAGNAPWESTLDTTEQPYPVGGPANPGIAQDVMLEAWTQSGGTSAGIAGRRLLQRVALVNSCAPTCRQVTNVVTGAVEDPDTSSDELICKKRHVAIDYGAIESPASYPGSTIPAIPITPAATASYGGNSRECATNPGAGAAGLDRYRGDAHSNVEGAIDVLDLRTLAGFIRQYDTTSNVVAPLDSDNLVSRQNCGDLDGDQRVTERDLGLLEKFLRGYLQWLPVGF